MKLSLDALRIVDAIHRRGSFAAAAEELHKVPSAITYAVQKLEQDLGVALFDRQGYRAAMTPAGQELLREGRLLLDAAAELEARVRRVATGWEAELHISLNDTISPARFYPLIRAFYEEQPGTRLRLSRDVLNGSWDALMGGRADLAIGAPADGPPGGGYVTRPMGEIDFVFAVAPGHPLAQAPEPLMREDLLRYRAIAVADSSRNLPPRTHGLVTGQDTLTVPDMGMKLSAHRHGLGIGFLPRVLAQADVAAGRLVVKEVAEPKSAAPCVIAWRSDAVGNALRWFVRRLDGMMINDLMAMDA